MKTIRKICVLYFPFIVDAVERETVSNGSAPILEERGAEPGGGPQISGIEGGDD